MTITKEGLEARINYKVETVVFESIPSYSTHIEMTVKNHTLEEVERATTRVKEMVDITETAAQALLDKIKG